MELEFNGIQYRTTGKLNAISQFHVARKLGPIFAKMGPSMTDAFRNPDLTVDLLAPMLEALAEMPEADCNYILSKCLSVVQRAVGGGRWSAVWNENANRMMFEDLDLALLIQLTLEVLQENLGNFLSAPASTSSQLSPAESGTLPGAS